MENDYLVVNIDFQLLSFADFEDEQSFVEAFSGEILDSIVGRSGIPEEVHTRLQEFPEGPEEDAKLSVLFRVLSKWCGQSEKPVVPIIDEVDSATNTLFDDMMKKMTDYPELKDMTRNILLNGGRYFYEEENFLINLEKMFGFLKEVDGAGSVSN